MDLDGRKRHPADARSRLELWIIEQGGPSKVARLLDISHVTVNLWTTRRFMPSLPLVCRILDLSNGFLTAHDILESTKHV